MALERSKYDHIIKELKESEETYSKVQKEFKYYTLPDQTVEKLLIILANLLLEAGDNLRLLRIIPKRQQENKSDHAIPILLSGTDLQKLEYEYTQFIKKIINENDQLFLKLHEMSTRTAPPGYVNYTSFFIASPVLTKLFKCAVELAVADNDYILLDQFKKLKAKGYKAQPELPVYRDKNSRPHFQALPALYYRYNNNKTAFVESNVFQILEEYFPGYLKEGVRMTTSPIKWAPTAEQDPQHKDFAKFLSLGVDPAVYKKSEGYELIKLKALGAERFKLMNDYALIVLEALTQYLMSNSKQFKVAKIDFQFFKYKYQYQGGKKITYKNQTVVLPHNMVKMIEKCKQAQKNPAKASSCLSDIFKIASSAIEGISRPEQRDYQTHYFYTELSHGRICTSLKDIMQPVEDANLKANINGVLDKVSFPNELQSIVLSYMKNSFKPLKEGQASWEQKPDMVIKPK